MSFISVYAIVFYRFGAGLIFYLRKFFFGRFSELIVTVYRSLFLSFFCTGLLFRDPLAHVSKMSLSLEDYFANGRAGNFAAGVATAMLEFLLNS